MVNFKPMHNHLMDCTWQLIEKYGAKDPFLDIGGGSGSLSLFLANKGWQGKLVDPSRTAFVSAKLNLGGTPIEVVLGQMSGVKGKFASVFLFDVIEHIKGDIDLLREARDRLVPGGYMLISVPMHASEWRNDDINYGHLRRYDPKDLKKQLEKLGLEVLEMYDYTFPFFWGMRRLYTHFVKKSKGNLEENTLASHKNSLFSFFNKFLGWRGLWLPLNAVQSLFKHRYWGCQLLVIARKKG